MRWLLILLLTIHGLIHLLGFPVAWGGQIEGLTGDMVIPLAGGALRALGLAWLLACLALLAAGLGLAQRREWWRPVALLGAVMSQLLVVLWWRDARAGTLANLIILAALAWPFGAPRWRPGMTAGVRS